MDNNIECLSHFENKNVLFYQLKSKHAKYPKKELISVNMLSDIETNDKEMTCSLWYRDVIIAFKQPNKKFEFLKNPIKYLKLGILYGENFTPFKLNGSTIINEFSYEEGLKLVMNRSFESDRLYTLLKLGRKCVVPNCKVVGDKICVRVEKGGSVHVDLYSKDYTMLTIDHIMPKSKGGANHISNYQMMCLPHNTQKGSKITESKKLHEHTFLKSFKTFIKSIL